MEKIYFMAGLPRSGSTLLANILAQNPRFHVSPTSGLVNIYHSNRENWGKNENLKFLEEKLYHQRCISSLWGLLHGFYRDVPEVVFDRNRSWPHFIESLVEVLGDVKIIAPVRDPIEIMASFEILWRKTNSINGVASDADMSTVERRAVFFSSETSPLGSSYNHLKDAFDRGHRDKIFLIDYDNFIYNPQRTLNEIYEFLGEELYTHQFSRIETRIYEDDRIHGYAELHKIDEFLRLPVSRAGEIFPLSLIDRYSGQDFWNY